jgi:hypothetical protein
MKSAALRVISCKYRFGRVELLPVKKSGEAVGYYLSDYLVKTYGLIPPGQRCQLVWFSRQISQAISFTFTILGIGNLIYRTRLKMAARMVNFQDYGDFAEYFGPRWNYLLKNALAWIPIPFRFPKGAFESGFALTVLTAYAENPKSFLDEQA